jgi:hypothetical protein
MFVDPIPGTSEEVLVGTFAGGMFSFNPFTATYIELDTPEFYLAMTSTPITRSPMYVGMNGAGLMSGDAGYNTVLNDRVNYASTNVPLLIYPQPTNSQLTMEYVTRETGIVAISIYDLLGRDIARHTYLSRIQGRAHHALDLSHYVSGTYFVQITLPSGEQHVKRIILLK